MFQHRAVVALVFIRAISREDHLQQQLVSGLVAGLPDFQQQRILLSPQRCRICRVVEDQAFDHMLQRPVDQLGTNVAVFQTQRARTRQLDRATNPPAFTGNGIQRALTVGAVSENTAPLFQPRLFGGRFGGSQQQQLELGE